MENSNRKSNHPWILYAWIALILISTLLLIIAFPHMREAFHESGMAALIQSHVKSQSQNRSIATANIYFSTPTPSLEEIEFISVSVPVQSLSRHAIIEALLRGPSKDALSQGAISYLPVGTTLIGITLSYEIAYIDFSREFLNPTIWEPTGHFLKYTQIRKTLQENLGVRDVVVLVEGELL